jgi:hypothetical protein
MHLARDRINIVIRTPVPAYIAVVACLEAPVGTRRQLAGLCAYLLVELHKMAVVSLSSTSL